MYDTSPRSRTSFFLSSANSLVISSRSNTSPSPIVIFPLGWMMVIPPCSTRLIFMLTPFLYVVELFIRADRSGKYLRIYGLEENHSYSNAGFSALQERHLTP